MAITSKITAKSVFGSHPAGYTDLTPNNNGELAFMAGSTLTKVFKFEAALQSYTPNDIPATQAAFLSEVKLYLDTTYMTSVFTDATKTYDARYIITNISLNFENVNGETGNSIWYEREYFYYVTINIQVNVN